MSLARDMWLLIPTTICWVVWEERNGRTFEDKTWIHRLAMDAIMSRLYDWLFAKSFCPPFHSWIFEWDSLVL